jgi:tetratricopeptide (TPR) repeat protein
MDKLRRNMKKTICFLLAAALLFAVCGCGNADKWQEQYDLGVKYLDEGNYEQAVLAFEAAVKIDPKNADGYFKLGISYRCAGKPDEAVTALKKAGELSPDGSADISNELSRAYMAAGQYGDAETLLKELYAGGSDEAGVLLIAAYGADGKTDELLSLIMDEKIAAAITKNAPTSGVTYIGAYDSEGKKSGYGVGYYPGGFLYAGEYADDVRSGTGFWTKGDSWYFFGQWANDMPNGQGTLTYGKGTAVNAGTYKDGLENGTMLVANGSAESYTAKDGVRTLLEIQSNGYARYAGDYFHSGNVFLLPKGSYYEAFGVPEWGHLG